MPNSAPPWRELWVCDRPIIGFYGLKRMEEKGMHYCYSLGRYVDATITVIDSSDSAATRPYHRRCAHCGRRLY